MSSDRDVERLLLWRLQRAESEAPAPPHAARLLELARPWWEAWPERFRAHADRLLALQPVVYGHAMTQATGDRAGHPVPALVVHVVEEFETSASILYFSIRDGRLRLRFQLDAGPARGEHALDVTFVSDDVPAPLLSATATCSLDNEYRLDAELPAELQREWADMKVMDRMPFRLILQSRASTR
jgi:hypothetical protein